MSAKLVSFIFCDEGRRGEGVEEDPVRIIYQLFDFEGNLVAEFDPYTRESHYNGCGEDLG